MPEGPQREHYYDDMAPTGVDDDEFVPVFTNSYVDLVEIYEGTDRSKMRSVANACKSRAAMPLPTTPPLC